MKKMTMAVGVLTLGATLAFAAPHAGKFQGGEGEGKTRAFAQLNLTDAQKQQIEEIRKSSRDANKAFFESTRATRDEYRAAKKAGDTAKTESLEGTMASQRAQMQQIRESEHSKIAAILTPDQSAKFDAMKQEMGTFGPGSNADRRKGMGRAVHGGMHGEMMGAGDDRMQGRMAGKLGLTDAQKQQFDAIHKAAREQNSASFESMRNLREEMRAARKANDTAKLEALKPRMEAQHAQMQKIRESMHAQISAILTPEQRAEFERMQEKKQGRKAHSGMHGRK